MQLKQIYKNILIITGKIVFLLFTIISMAFVNKEYKKKKVQIVNIKIISNNHPSMCSIEDIEDYLYKKYELKDKSYNELNFYALENYINQKNEIKKSAVYFTSDKQLCIQVTERKPIARIFTQLYNYYIDDEWKTFQVTKTYQVPVISGNIYQHPDIFKHYPITKILKSENFKHISIFDDIYLALHTLLSDSLLLQFIDYIYITKNQEITLYPAIGKFKVIVGRSEHFQEKMNKLKLLLIHGLNKNDAWDKYSEINLKYKNLVYCTKK